MEAATSNDNGGRKEDDNGDEGRLSRMVDGSLPWVAGGATTAGILITSLSGVPAHLPGIALDSTSLFLVERGGAVVAALIVATGLVGRTLKRELPTGFSPATGAVTYPDKVKAAASASDAAAKALSKRLNKLETDAEEQKAETATLVRTLKGVTAEIKRKTAPGSGPWAIIRCYEWRGQSDESHGDQQPLG